MNKDDTIDRIRGEVGFRVLNTAKTSGNATPSRKPIAPDVLFSQLMSTNNISTGTSSRAERQLTRTQRFLRLLDPRRSIKSRLAVAMFCVSILFLLTSACIVGFTVINNLRESSGRSLMQFAMTTARTIDEMIYARYRDMRIISTLPFVRDPSTDSATLQSVLDETKGTYELYSWIGITTNNGTVKAATDGVLSNVNVSARPWFKACRNASFANPPRFVGDVHGAVLLQRALNLTEPLRLLDVALPLFAMNQTQIGVIGSHINASVTRMVEHAVLGTFREGTMELFIIGTDSLVQAPVGSTENSTDWISQSPDSALMLARAGQTGWRVERWPSGAQYLTGFSQCSGIEGINMNWSILVRQSTATAFAAPNRLVLILGLAHLGFAIILVGTSYTVAHITTAPLLAISRAADNIRKRSAMPQIPVVHGNDEIARLSYSLNSLVSTLVEKEINLKGINQDLADKVEALERAEASLRASEDKFRQVTDTTQDAFFILEILPLGEYSSLVSPPTSDDAGVLPEKWVHMSAAFVKLFGISAMELEDDPTTWLQVVAQEDQQAVAKVFAERQKSPIDITFRVIPGPLADSQRLRYIALRSLLVKSKAKDHTPKRVIGVFQDISLQKQAEIASQHKSSWVRQVGHEIRNPLAATFTMINLLLEMDMSAEQLDLLQTIRTSNDNLLSLINSILDLAKLEAGEMHLETIPFNLATQVEDVLDLMAPQAHKKGLRVGGCVDPTIHPLVKGDPLRLRQVIINLFTNAVKFTQKGSVFLRVERDAEYTSSLTTDGHGQVALRFLLTDTGIGISKENQGKLFKEFAQAEASTSRHYGGTGLGLSIVRQLVNMMNGDVGIISETGKGSTFYFTAVFLADRMGFDDGPPLVPPLRIDNKRILILSAWDRTHEVVHAAVKAIGGIPVDTVHFPTAIQLVEQGGFAAAILDVDLEQKENDEAFNRISGKVPVVIVVSREKMETIRHRLIPEKVIAVTDPIKTRRLQDELSHMLLHLGPAPVGQETARRSKAQKTTPNVQLLQPNGQQWKSRIMLVEDNLINQKAVAKLLSRITGEVPLVAHDGQMCLDMLAECYRKGNLMDIIFMDVCMPVMDGLTATRAIMEQYSDKVRPIVITMTANALHEDYVQCMQAGADGYLLKPASRDILEKTIEQWGSIVRQRRSSRASSVKSVTSLHLEDIPKNH
ncbi:hypothetical protein SpCBS45565_g05381 [Spizellomyces sp. 'palustris']|nr:hypothetical protein SpCBS45565_g05381 [Spizellomyces sp. 'palustris']